MLSRGQESCARRRLRLGKLHISSFFLEDATTFFLYTFLEVFFFFIIWSIWALGMASRISWICLWACMPCLFSLQFPKPIGVVRKWNFHLQYTLKGFPYSWKGSNMQPMFSTLPCMAAHCSPSSHSQVVFNLISILSHAPKDPYAYEGTMQTRPPSP